MKTLEVRLWRRLALLALCVLFTAPLFADPAAPFLECRTPDVRPLPGLLPELGLGDGSSILDCSATSTNPSPDYEPGLTYQIPVVVHVIMNNDGSQGQITDELVYSQIDVMNEDYQALPGTNGAPGYDVRFHFVLADEDLAGQQTSGITRSQNTTWFNDQGSYWLSLAWDPNRFVNVYSNSAAGARGYVPFLPQSGPVGMPEDRVVINSLAFGRPGPVPTHEYGRTVTHETGHYFGLYHPFLGCGSATPPGCYSDGDLICDTNPEQQPFTTCGPPPTSCGSPDPISNYMDYSDDICLDNFTQEQARRMRCTIEGYRPAVYTPIEPDRLFQDSFESGNLAAWPATEPDNGGLIVSAAAAMEGSQGLELVLDDTNRVWVEQQPASEEDRYRARFWLDPNDLVAPDNRRFKFFTLFSDSAGTFRVASMTLRYQGGQSFLRFKVHQQDGSWAQLPWVVLEAGPNLIEVDWQRASAGTSDGHGRLWVNSRPQGEAAHDVDDRGVARGRLGAVGGVDAGMTGHLYLDGFEARRSLYIGK